MALARPTLATSLLVLGALAAPLAGAGAASLEKAAVVAPKSGAKYAGTTAKKGKVTFIISGKSIEIFAFDFPCGRKPASGSSSIQSLPLKRTDDGYRFKVKASGIVSYSDAQPDENGTISVSGTFSRSAKTVSGLLRIKTRRCHDTGDVRWSASRRTSR